MPARASRPISFSLNWIKVAILFLGSSAALYQYFSNSRQSKAIKAADEMNAFISDEAVKLVTNA
jgi:hypothetical protein